MNISRRRFFRLVPASVGAVLLGSVVLPKEKRSFIFHQSAWGEATDIEQSLDQMIETTIASGRMVEPPLAINVFPDGLTYIDVPR